jgi:hypothetical protein
MLIIVGRLPSRSSKIVNCCPRGAARSHSALLQEDHESRRRQSPGSLHRLRNRNRHLAAVHRTSRRVEIYGPKACDRARPTMGGRGRARSSSRVIRPPLDCEAIRLSLISHGTCQPATPSLLHPLISPISQRLIITTPATASPTVFHPAAYMPAVRMSFHMLSHTLMMGSG